MEHFLHNLYDPAVQRAGILVCFLALLHLLSPFIRKIFSMSEIFMSSLGGGFVVAFIFLHLLPGLAENQHALGAVLAKNYDVTPFLDLLIYFVGLLGFLLFLGLQRWVDFHHAQNSEIKSLIFYPHLIALLILNGIIAYTMPLRVQIGGGYSLLFTFVMTLHLMLVDRSLEEKLPAYFYARGRYWLILSLGIGWLWAIWDEPDQVLTAALLNAFLGGSVLLNVFRNEIPSSKQSSFPWFLIGCLLGSVLLGTLAYMQS